MVGGLGSGEEGRSGCTQTMNSRTPPDALHSLATQPTMPAQAPAPTTHLHGPNLTPPRSPGSARPPHLAHHPTAPVAVPHPAPQPSPFHTTTPTPYTPPTAPRSPPLAGGGAGAPRSATSEPDAAGAAALGRRRPAGSRSRRRHSCRRSHGWCRYPRPAAAPAAVAGAAPTGCKRSAAAAAGACAAARAGPRYTLADRRPCSTPNTPCPTPSPRWPHIPAAARLPPHPTFSGNASHIAHPTAPHTVRRLPPALTPQSITPPPITHLQQSTRCCGGCLAPVPRRRGRRSPCLWKRRRGADTAWRLPAYGLSFIGGGAAAGGRLRRC